jgi:thymidylate kinase
MIPEGGARQRTQEEPVSPRGALARSLFRFLEREGFAYTFMGDSEQLDAGEWGDLDLVVEEVPLQRLTAALWAFGREHGLRLVQLLQHDRSSFYFVLASRPTGDAAPQYVQPDVCLGDYVRRGRRLLAAADVLATRQRTAGRGGNPGFFVPSPEVTFIAYFLKKVDKRDLAEAHEDFLGRQWARAAAGCRRQLARFWSPPTAARIARQLETGNWQGLRDDLPALRRELMAQSSLSFAERGQELRRRVERVLQPTGFWLAILGPDGSGKSTVASRVAEDLLPAFRRTRHYHLRPRLAERARANPAITDPHAHPVRGRAASLAKLLWWWSDYTAGFAIDLFPRCVQSTLILFDRHFWDVVVDPLRYRYGGSPSLAARFARWTIQPSLFVLLDASTDVLHSRKREVAAPEIERQRAAYRQLLQRLPGSQIVDASRSSGEVASAITDLVLERLRVRTARRLGLPLDESSVAQ